jgi:hypothetical protein
LTTRTGPRRTSEKKRVNWECGGEREREREGIEGRGKREGEKLNEKKCWIRENFVFLKKVSF